MTREQLEHLIRAASVIADDETIVVLGSQAILGQYPDAPEVLRVSVEADLFPWHYPDRADLIEGSIGELSPFHETYGYYAHGIDAGTALLPAGWRDRLVPIQNENTRGARGLCLEIHDLLVAKTLAGREKDLEFLREAARHQLADIAVLLMRLGEVEVDPALASVARNRIHGAFGAPPGPEAG
jgi:hypothetical protein